MAPVNKSEVSEAVTLIC